MEITNCLHIAISCVHSNGSWRKAVQVILSGWVVLRLSVTASLTNFDRQMHKCKALTVGTSPWFLCDHFKIHYSGHGGRLPDQDGDEDDGYDETLIPVDFQRNGMWCHSCFFPFAADRVVILTLMPPMCKCSTLYLLMSFVLTKIFTYSRTNSWRWLAEVLGEAHEGRCTSNLSNGLLP